MTPLTSAALQLRFLATAALYCLAPAYAEAQAPGAPSAPRSAPITNVRYELTFDSTTAQRRTVRVGMSFRVGGPGPVLLSLPAWTPGAYEISNFARWVSEFAAEADGRRLTWDKLDYDTWRIQSGAARAVTVTFDYLADSLDNAIAWTRPDFLLLNGTNVFLYPEGRGLDFAATVSVQTQPGWLVATGMPRAAAGGEYRATNYHDLVDMPFFIGRMDYDSTQVSGKWTRLASYPAGALTGRARTVLWDQIAKTVPVMAAVFQEVPWERYTVMVIFERGYRGGSALEHQNSHVGVYNPQFMGNPLLASITAHEIFHAWNVKRLRPADLWPYHYDSAQPTVWLWVSEGITDYYSDLALVRGGVVDSAQFMALTAEKIGDVTEVPATALEDASLSTWVQPTDGTAYLYYPKGSLAGLMLDIMIRDASDNRRSLDDVMRELYRGVYKRGRGFTARDWWDAVSRAAGGRSFAEFHARYVHGRDSYPWDRILPLAGMRLAVDTLRAPAFGVASIQDSAGIRVVQVKPDGIAGKAGVQPDDRLLAVGEIAITNPDFGAAYRSRFGRNEGDSLPIKVLRGADTLVLHGTVQLATRLETRIVADPAAPEKAQRIRSGILRGKTDR